MVGARIVLPLITTLVMMAVLGIAAGIFLIPLFIVMYFSSYVFNTAKFVANVTVRRIAVVLTIVADIYAFFVINYLLAAHLRYLVAQWPYFLHLSFGPYLDVAISVVLLLVSTILIKRNRVFPQGVSGADEEWGETTSWLAFLVLMAGMFAVSIYLGYWYGLTTGVLAFGACIGAGWIVETLIRKARGVA
jgi:hypothetical protein